MTCKKFDILWVWEVGEGDGRWRERKGGWGRETRLQPATPDENTWKLRLYFCRLSSAAHRNELPFKLCNYLIPVNLGLFDLKITDFEPKTKGSEIICGKSWGARNAISLTQLIVFGFRKIY